MKKTTLIAGIVLVVGLVIIVLSFFIGKASEQSQQTSTSDASKSKGSITIGMDNFIGYFPLCSPYMKKLMLADGYKLDCVDDKADYSKRFENLRNENLDFAVSTLDAYILTGERTNYPGIITAVLDESKGADAIVSHIDYAKTLTELKNNSDLRVAFTPESPSDHLRKAVGIDFDIPLLKDNGEWSIRVNGSSEARESLKSGKSQIAILWEPDLSKILSDKDFVKLLGTEQTSGLIVDVLIVNRDYYQDKPETVSLLLSNYFKTLKYYRDNLSKFESDSANYAKVSKTVAKSMLSGVKWVNLTENATDWMGVSISGKVPNHKLFDSAQSTIRILKDFGDVVDNPLPGDDPRSIINSQIVSDLYNRGIQPGQQTSFIQEHSPNSLETDFSPLSENAWNLLNDVGILKVRPIRFGSSLASLDIEDKKQLDLAVDSLKSYPNFRIEIQGHTSPRGDESINQQLSQDRADSVSRYLLTTYGIDKDRIRSIGKGSNIPIPRKPGESLRANRSKQSRVEIHLKTEVY